VYFLPKFRTCRFTLDFSSTDINSINIINMSPLLKTSKNLVFFGGHEGWIETSKRWRFQNSPLQQTILIAYRIFEKRRDSYEIMNEKTDKFGILL